MRIVIIDDCIDSTSLFTSSMVLCFPALTRIDSKFFLSEIPIAFKTGEGLIVPEEQADPFEIAIPSLSRWINKRSLEIFGIVRLINPGRWFLLNPLKIRKPF